jgi:predicted nucleotidyltransferase
MTDAILDRDPALTEIVRRIVATLKPDRVYLFGSLARAEGDGSSDYDLMVVVSDPQEPTYRLAQRAHSALWGLRVAADVVVWSADRFNRRAHLKASLAGTVLREGTLVYAA